MSMVSMARAAGVQDNEGMQSISDISKVFRTTQNLCRGTQASRELALYITGVQQDVSALEPWSRSENFS